MSMTTKADDVLAFLDGLQPLHRRGARWRTQTLQVGLRLAELIVFFLVGIAVSTEMPLSVGAVPPAGALLAACLATVAAIEIGRTRRSIRPRPAALALQVVAASVTGVLVLLLVGLSWRLAIGWAVGELVGTAILLAALHALYSQIVEMLLADGRLATHVAVVGSGTSAHLLQTQLESADPLAIKVVGRYTVTEPAPLDGARGTMRTLLSDCRLEFVDAIVLATEPDESGDVTDLHRSLRACTQDIYVLPASRPEKPEAVHTKLGPADLVLVSRRPISGGAAFAKRAFDLLGSLALLMFMAPLLGMLAFAIALDSRGPILFRQLRVGYNNQLFYILKFRSMRDDATDRLAKQQTVRGDKRVTRVGRIIRRLSLDELPQLLNVLRGEMSLVGPRPHAPGTSIGGQRVHTIVDDYACRHLVRPGITGLAQVRGLRGGLQDRRQVADRLAADLEYIERWSVWLDIRILLGTVLLELRNSRGC